ncbi:uncharacterized protein LOC108596318 isoform X11 [Drosophila busckii]|uniref:uncharacterized protein LOC108596318 isoform X11 n=1 Tax=Drosophila busckii TaxID=30019 RepID=UPI00083EA11B|nr:uncharacterized protein LOC108596318 isoform X11 [Drosophila busckii]
MQTLYLCLCVYACVYACSMDFTLGLVTGMYAVVAVIVFYVVYIIEVKLDLPAIVNANNNNNNINNNNNNSSSTELAETRLRSLIESIIAETLRCSSALSASAAVSEISLDTRAQGEVTLAKRRHRTEHYFEPQIYQELLATAVLNKLADKEGNSRLIAESTPDLSAHNIDENYNAEALSTTSGSSIEPRSDCSLTDHELQLNSKQDALHENLQPDLERESVLSDYIAAHMVPLPDFSASVTESEDEIMSMTSSMMGEGTWEDNWLFKKKRSSATPSSIGMLVPAPKEHVRAQIGDRTADEVSDLSEMGSDAEESSLDMLRCNELNDRLLSKHLIGGQNTKLVLDELLDNSSLNSNTLPGEGEPAYAETSNTLVTQPTAALTIETAAGTDFGAPPPPMIFQDENEENVEPVQNLIADQLSAAHRQSTESTPSTSEEFFGNGEASAAQEFISYSSMQMAERLSSSTNCEITNTKTNSLNTDTNKARTLRPNGKLTNGSLKWCNKSLNDLENGHNLEVVDVDVNVDVDDAEDDVVLLRRFVPGSIAEREVKKWYNAVEMPNNPYAPEALKQRISGTQERLMDVPNISPSAEQKTLELLTNAGKDEPVSRVDDCKRYSRDYYINSTAASKSSPSNSSRDRHSDSPQADQTDEDIVINEVNDSTSTHGQRISSSARCNLADHSHWTLSTPVRRSSSLKFINKRTSNHSLTANEPSAYEPMSMQHERPATSASHYNDLDLDEFELRSQRSWRSSTGTRPRHTQSTLSLHSNVSGVSFGSSASKRRSLGPSAAVLTQFEKQLLHKDLKRNSFRAVSATSKDFVMNPLFECQLQLKPSLDDQDSGVDSCLNGFSGADAKQSNNSLLF